MNEDKMRKAFEALCEKRWAGSRGVFALREDGEYENGNVQFGWACYQAAARTAVPDGWKVVPLEPTPEMIEKGEKAHWGKEMDIMSPTPTEFYGECGGPIGYAWIAMLAVAPEVKP